MIDQAKKIALIDHIKQRRASNEGEILLAPDLYFDGYDDERLQAFAFEIARRFQPAQIGQRRVNIEQCTVCANVGPFSTVQFAARLREIGRRARCFSSVHSVLRL